MKRLCGSLVVVLLLSTACIVDMEYEGRRHGEIKIACNQVLPHQAQAELIVKTRAEEYFGESLDVDTRVFWTDTYCHYPGQNGVNNTAVVWRGQCYAGLEFSCEEIYVAHRGLISSSAFAHELGHCYRWYLDMDTDGTHKKDPEFWSFMASVDAELGTREW